MMHPSPNSFPSPVDAMPAVDLPGPPSSMDTPLTAVDTQGQDALQREWELLSSVPETIRSGLVERAREAWDNKPATAAALMGAGVAGTLFAITKNLAVASDAATLALKIAPLGLIGLDGLRRVGLPMVDTWRNPDHLAADKKQLGDNLGAALIDYPLMGLAAGIGVGSGSGKFAEIYHGATDGRAAALDARLSFTDFRAQMRTLGLTEEDLLSTSYKTENFVARGHFHEVYKIDGMNDYLLRTELNQRVDGTIVPPEPGRLEEVEDWWPGKNIGQPVARLGRSEIIKKVQGEPLGAGSISHIFGPAELMKRAAGVRLAASMPQSAYDDLAQTLAQFPKRGLKFDAINPGNILADQAAQRFNVVDVEKEDFNQPHLWHMLRPLTGAIRIYDMEPQSQELQPYYRTIVEKTMSAARASRLPVMNHDEVKDIFEAAGMLKQYHQLLPLGL